ncbi:MAG: DNA-3-methyladenine glycosylase I [Pseudomonadota bacterium]
MTDFATIRARAAERKGGDAALDALLAEVSEPRDISALTDDRLLSEFSKRVFQAGFNWSVIEKKWPGFEEAFDGFNVPRNAMMSDEDLDAHLKDTRIVRHARKILSIRDNAIFLSELAQEHGSAAKAIGDWPSSDLVGLWDVLKKRGARLGGTTAQYALRFMGKDCFIMGRSVVAALNEFGVIDGAATSKSAQKRVQEAFNEWHAETGESYTRMSRILAMSVPD